MCVLRLTWQVWCSQKQWVVLLYRAVNKQRISIVSCIVKHKYKYSVSLSIGTPDIRVFPNESAVSFYRFCSLNCQQWFQLPVCEGGEIPLIRNGPNTFRHTLLSLFSVSLTITYSYDRPLLPLARSTFTLQCQIGMPFCWRSRVRFLLFILYFPYGVEMFWKLKQP